MYKCENNCGIFSNWNQNIVGRIPFVINCDEKEFKNVNLHVATVFNATKNFALYSIEVPCSLDKLYRACIDTRFTINCKTEEVKECDDYSIRLFYDSNGNYIVNLVVSVTPQELEQLNSIIQSIYQEKELNHRVYGVPVAIGVKILYDSCQRAMLNLANLSR